MKTITITTPGGTDLLVPADAPTPEPGAGQVRVRVAAAGVNPVDLAVRQGVFHQAGLVTRERIGLGWEASGTVEAVGDGVSLPVGTRVAGLIGGFDREASAYGEQVVLAAADLAVVPDDLDLVEAATVPLNALTAVRIAELLGAGEGRRLLVTGAAGAVGGYLLRFAAEAGWQVTGLARAADEDWVSGQGAAFTTSADPGWDAVADPATMGADALALVADGGRYVGVLPAFPVAPERGVDVRDVEVAPDGATLATLLRRTAAGELPVRLAGVLPLADAAKAHEALAAGGVRGRYVLVP